MSIKALPDSSLYHQMFTREQLETYVSTLNAAEVNDLQREVYFKALTDGVTIEDWNRDWGRYHLFDSTTRLVHTIFKKKCVGLFHAFGQDCPDGAAKFIAYPCPLFLKNLLSTQADPALTQRVRIIARLRSLNHNLCTKYPQLFADSSSIQSAWKVKEMHYLSLPESLGSKEMEQFEYLTSVIEEVVKGDYDEIAAEIILERLLRKEFFHPTSTDLSNDLRLRSIHKMTIQQIHNHSLQTSDQSAWKPIYVIPSDEDKQGKFKPLDIHSAMKEVYAAQCDRLCGLGMSAPTGLLRNKNIFSAVYEVKKLFEASSRQENGEKAALLRQHAFELFHESHIPQEVRNCIFGEMYTLCGDRREIDSLGEKLFYSTGGCSTSDREKCIAIQNYLNSEAFKNHVAVFNVQGSVQPWIHDCRRAVDLIRKDPTGGGEKLKTAPKALVHFYALLGIIKGSVDCSSDNTFVDYRPELGRVVNFWDFDDEKSMPISNDVGEFRMWHMGMPQNAQPFDRAILLMFLDPRLTEKFKRQQTSLQISKAAYGAQIHRLEKLKAIFAEELSKEKITLTPRELFFKMFGGKEEFINIKSRFNNDKSYSEEGVRISPIEIFEFHLANEGKGLWWYTSDEGEKTLVGRNMRELYAPDLP